MEHPVKTSSTEEEALAALFYEKKKNKILESKLKTLEERISDPETYPPDQYPKPSSIHLEEEFVNLQDSYKKLKQQHLLSLSALGDAQEETKALRGQQTALKDLIERAKQEKIDRERELAHSKNEIDRAKNDSELHRKEAEKSDRLREEIAEKEAELLKQENRFSDLYNREVERQKEIDELRNTLQETEQNLLHLKTSHQALQKNHVELEKIRNEHSLLEKEQTELKKNFEDSLQHGRQLERVIRFLREKNEEALLQKQQLETEYESYSESLGKLKSEKDEWVAGQNAIHEELDAEKTKGITLTLELDREAEKRFELLKKIDVLTQEIHSKEQIVNEIKKSSDSLKEENRSLQSEILMISDEVGYLRPLKQKNSELRDQLDEKIRTLDEYKNRIEALEKESGDRIKDHEEKQGLIRHIAGLEEKLKYISNESEEKNESFEQQQRTVNDLKASLASREATYHSELHKINARIYELENQKLEAQKNLEEIKRDLVSEQRRRECEGEEKRIIREEYTLLQNLLQEQKNIAESDALEKEDAQQRLLAISTEYEQFKKDTEELRKTTGKEREKFVELVSERDSLYQQVITIKKMWESEKISKDEIISHSASIEESLAELKNEYKALQEESKEKIAAYDNSLRTVKELKASLSARETAHHSELLDYRDKLLELQNSYNKLKEEKSKLDDLKPVLNEVTGQKDRIEEMYNDLRALYEQSQDAAGILRKEKDELAHRYNETDLKIRDFENRLKDKQKEVSELTSEKISIEEQMNLLKNLLDNAKEKIEQESQKYEEAKALSDKLSNQNIDLEKQKETLKENISALTIEKTLSTKEFSELREKVHSIEREKDHIDKKYRDAISDFEYTKKKLDAILEESDQCREKCKNFMEKTEVLEKRNKELADKNSILLTDIDHTINKLQSESTVRTETEKKYEELNYLFKQKESTLEVLKYEKQNLDAEYNRIKQKYEEIQAGVQIAQQHLAKKVKETAILSEEIEGKNRKLGELQQNVGFLQNQFAEAGKNLESHIREKKSLEIKLQETIHQSEANTRNWEMKYDQIIKQKQQVDFQNRELLKYKEKLDRLQPLLSNLTGMMGMQAPVPDVAPATFQEPASIQFRQPVDESKMFGMSSPALSKETDQGPSHSSPEDFSFELNEEFEGTPALSPPGNKEESPYQNLFDLSNHKTKHKKNLFE